MVKIDIFKKLKDKELKIKATFDNKIYAIIAPNGAGKSTFLKIVAGLEKADGYIEVDNQIWLDKNINIKPYNRDISFVFQDIALFPNMNVIENILYANNDIKFAMFLLDILNIKHLQYKKIDFLSGGEAQKVAIARAFMKRAKLVLLDEPFSALDKDIKPTIYKAIKLYQKRFNATILLVTHDLNEANILADEIFNFNLV